MVRYYVDAAEVDGGIISLGIYSADIGLGVCRKINGIDAGVAENVNYGEIMAIREAVIEGGATEIFSDSKTAISIYLGRRVRPKYLDGVDLPSIPEGCDLKWIPRGQNRIADWIAKSFFQMTFQFPPGFLVEPRKKAQPADGKPREERLRDIRQAGAEKVQAYQDFTRTISIDSVRSAEDWMIEWLIDDAEGEAGRERLAAFENLKETHQRLKEKYRRVLVDRDKAWAKISYYEKLLEERESDAI